MESSISARPGAQRTTKSFEKAMRQGGKGSEKRWASFLGGILAGNLTRFGVGQPSLDLVRRVLRKLVCVPDSLGPKMRTESFSPWQVTKPQSSSRKHCIAPKVPSVIASLSWARAVAFI